MERGAKPAKAKAETKSRAARNPRKIDDLLVRQSDESLAEASAQLTAISEILRVISGAQTDVQPVFDAIVRSALRLFGGLGVAITVVDRNLIQLAASGGGVFSTEAARKRFPMPLTRESVSGQSILECVAVQIADTEAAEAPEYARSNGRALGFRANAAAPLMRENVATGSLVVMRKEPGRFSDKQMKLLQTFADQAVIAIENVRLFNETKEALERQTATADILRVISGSPTDTQPVFEVILDRATKLCDAETGILFRYENGAYYAQATRIPNAEFAATFKEPRRPGPGSKTGLGRLMREKRTVHIPDLLQDAAYAEGDPMRLQTLRGGVRTWLGVPLLKEGELIGAILVYRSEPRAFREQQIFLLETFADQAVIAIENVRLFNETKEALERQTATAEILKVIAGSPTDVQPVFDVIVESAVRLCGARFGRVYRYDGSVIQMVAGHGLSTNGLAQVQRVFPRPAANDTIVGRVILTRRPFYVRDIEREETVPALSRQMIEALGTRSQVTIPMLRAGEPIGAITMGWDEPDAFDDQQVALLQTFADQAVIAIENVRLFNETKEALERQTATGEILASISGSMTDTKPVFDAIVRNLLRLFGTQFAVVVLPHDGKLELAAFLGEPGFEKLAQDYPVPIDGQSTLVGQVASSGQAMQLAPMVGNPATPPVTERFARQYGFNAQLSAPMIREGKVIGVIATARREPVPFNDKQVALVKAFADQAVIAIENVRLFNETKEALERQTATSQILRAISGSLNDIAPVFDIILENAIGLCGGDVALLWQYDGQALRFAAGKNTSQEGEAYSRAHPLELGSYNPTPRAGLERRTMHVLDVFAEPGYRPLVPPGIAPYRPKASTVLAVPLLRENDLFGVITIWRFEKRLFTEKQVEMVNTFADQAVIAIENVRLFKELQARTEALTRSVGQLTALGEVGQAISSTLDLETVLKTVVSRALQLAGLDAGVIYEYDEPTGQFQLRASENFDNESVARLRGASIRKGEGAVGASVVTHEPTQVPDTHAPDYPVRLRELLDRAGFRAVLAVPLLREAQIIGALMVLRKAAGPFAPEIVELLQTFATQSAMAIQNARLFREIAEKGEQLEVASRHKSDFLASMSHELRTPLNAILGFNEMILGQVYGEVPADMQVPLADIQTSGKHLLRLINNVLDLAKIEAGRMELSLQDYSVHDTVESVRSTLRPLAAEKGLEFVAMLPDDLPLAYGDSGRIAQCLMNLAGNSLKFTKAGKVEIAVETRGDLLVYKVADTGIGIPPDKLETVFAEFKQTDATIASEYGGTGLGLSISRKFVEMHGGRIWVESELGKGSTFFFEIPLRVSTGAPA